MKKISLNNIIKFRKKDETRRKSFLDNIFKEVEIKTDGGGNYWVRSLSALSKSVETKSSEPVYEKISEITALFNPDLRNQTKVMYERNLNILHNYEDFDFEHWLPADFKIIKKSKNKTIIEIEKVPVQVTPSQIFSFANDNQKFVGAIWFVAKLEGYSKEELGMFAESMHIYLTYNFNSKF